MEQKHNLTDISNAIAKVIDNPVVRTIRSGVIGVLGIAHPVAGVVADVGNNLLSEYNDFKLSQLLMGLSTGLDIEMQLNELYNYVASSPEKAVNVANLFRKTINAECPKVCIIYGLILANHVANNTDFTQDELIVCRALENATEFDLKNFKEIMENYLRTTSKGNMIAFPEDFPALDNFTTTCEWGLYNRLFVSHAFEWGDTGDGGGTLDMDTYYYAGKPASVLMNYINDARQTWHYGESVQD